MKKNCLKAVFYAASILVCSLMLSVPAMAADKAYINGIDANYPPFAYVDESGNPSGFDVDSMNWIAKKMGFTISHTPMDWDGIIPALIARKIDMVCSGMSVSPERAKRVTFTDPYWTVTKVFVVKDNSPLSIQDATMGGKRMGVQRGTNEAEMLQQMLEKKDANFTLRFYDSAPMGIEDLLNGRIDAFGLDSAPANDAMSKGKAIKVLSNFGSEDRFAVATRNEDKDLRELINQGYKLLMADPYWKELQAKYLK